MTTEQVPLAAQIEKVRREIGYAQDDDEKMAERLWSAVLASLQQHGRAMAEMEAAYQNCAELAMTYHGRLERAMAVVEAARVAVGTAESDPLRIYNATYALGLALAALDDAASAAATPAGKGEAG